MCIRDRGFPVPGQFDRAARVLPLFKARDHLQVIDRLEAAGAEVPVREQVILQLAHQVRVSPVRGEHHVPRPVSRRDPDARELRKGAALIVKDADAVKDLMPTALDLVANDAKIQELEKNISELALTDAGKTIVDCIYKVLDK